MGPGTRVSLRESSLLGTRDASPACLPPMGCYCALLTRYTGTSPVAPHSRWESCLFTPRCPEHPRRLRAQCCSCQRIDLRTAVVPGGRPRPRQTAGRVTDSRCAPCRRRRGGGVDQGRRGAVGFFRSRARHGFADRSSWPPSSGGRSFSRPIRPSSPSLRAEQRARRSGAALPSRRSSRPPMPASQDRSCES